MQGYRKNNCNFNIIQDIIRCCEKEDEPFQKKNPEYIKKPPLTPAEKMQRSRQSKSAEEKNKVNKLDRKRKAAKRADQTKEDNKSKTVQNSKQYDTTSRTKSYNNITEKTPEQSEEIRNEVYEKGCKSIEGKTECKVIGKTTATSTSAKTLSDAERKRMSRQKKS